MPYGFNPDLNVSMYGIHSLPCFAIIPDSVYLSDEFIHVSKLRGQLSGSWDGSPNLYSAWIQSGTSEMKGIWMKDFHSQKI